MAESAQGGCTEAPVVTAQYRAVHTQTSVTRRAQRRRGRQAQASALERHPAPGGAGPARTESKRCLAKLLKFGFKHFHQLGDSCDSCDLATAAASTTIEGVLPR